MDTQEIIEGNKLIAVKFLRWVHDNYNHVPYSDLYAKKEITILLFASRKSYELIAEEHGKTVEQIYDIWYNQNDLQK